MKGKIIVAIICMMLLTTFFAVANNIKDLDSKEIREDTKPLSFDDVDVPVWETGDSWTFNIANMEFVIDDENLSENLTMEINAQIGDFTLEVIDDSGDVYQVGILETIIAGDGKMLINDHIIKTWKAMKAKNTSVLNSRFTA